MNPMDLLNWQRPEVLPDYPWREMEMDRAKSALLDQLQRSQEEALKKQELERGMEEQKLKEAQFKQNMMVRALQGWQPPVGVDVGEFSRGGAPLQQKAIGPGISTPNIAQFDQQWSQPVAQGELAEMIKRQLFFPKAEPSQMEFPQEKAAREKSNLLDVTTRQQQIADKSQLAKEKREQLYFAQRDKEQAEKERVASEVADAKAYQSAVRQAVAGRIAARNKVIAQVNAAQTQVGTPAMKEEAKKYGAIALRDIDTEHQDELARIEESFGFENKKRQEDLKFRKAFAEVDPAVWASLGVSSSDQFKAGAQQAGLSVEQAIELVKLHEKESKRGKSK